MPLIEKLAPRLATVERFIVLTDAAHMPATSLRNAAPYEEWLAEADEDFRWAAFDENTAAGLCLHLRHHRQPEGRRLLAPVEHPSLDGGQRRGLPRLLGARRGDAGRAALPCQRLVLRVLGADGRRRPRHAGAAARRPFRPRPPGEREHHRHGRGADRVARPPAASRIDRRQALDPEARHHRRLGLPRAITEAFERKYGVTVAHAWGMTEMSPVGSFCTIKPDYAHLDGDALLDLKAKQGFAPSIEMTIENDEGLAMPWDGKARGRLKVRGPAVARAYYRDEGGSILDEEGFFDTGDVATIDPHGYVHISDRSKDVIKSGGEWISSIELENLAVGTATSPRPP